LSLLALIDNETGSDRNWAEVKELAANTGLRTPNLYDFGVLEEVVAQQPLLP